MAKKPGPETDDAEKDEKPSSGGLKGKLGALFGNKKILFGGIGALVLIGAGAGFFLMSGHGGEPKKEEAAAAEEAKVVEPQIKFIDLPEMTVNLAQSGSQRPQYLKVKIALETSDPLVAKQIDPVMPRVLDTFQLYLRELRANDLEGSAGVQRLKEELAKRVNQAIHPAHIDSVLFREMLIQ